MVEVARTSQLCEKMQDDMDINAGRVQEESSLQDVADDMQDQLARALEGEQTKTQVKPRSGILALYTVAPSL